MKKLYLHLIFTWLHPVQGNKIIVINGVETDKSFVLGMLRLLVENLRPVTQHNSIIL